MEPFQFRSRICGSPGAPQRPRIPARRAGIPATGEQGSSRAGGTGSAGRGVGKIGSRKAGCARERCLRDGLLDGRLRHRNGAEPGQRPVLRHPDRAGRHSEFLAGFLGRQSRQDP